MRILVLLILMVAMPPIHAEEPGLGNQRAWQAYHLAVAETPGDVHSDLTIARLLQFLARSYRDTDDSDDARALQARSEVITARLLERVAAQRDSDPSLLVRDLGCWPEPKSATCSERRARLETMAADNAYYGMILMAYAWLAEDAKGFLGAARLAAAAERYDNGIVIPFDTLRERYRSVPAPRKAGEDEREPKLTPDVTAMMVSAGVALPPLQHFSQPCRESEGELREHCLTLALKMMSQSQSILEILIAQPVVEALGTAEDIESAKMIRRDVDWLMARSFPLSAAMEHADVAGTQEFFDAYATDGELSAMRVLLTAHNIPIHPPEGWTKD